MMKEDAAYDNLPVKQSGRETSVRNARDPSWRVSTPSDNPPAINRAAMTPARHQLAFPAKRRKQYQRDDYHDVAGHKVNAQAKTSRGQPNAQRSDYIANLFE
jgi:hypothetical protein